MIDDYPTLVFRIGEYEVIEGLDLVVQVKLSTNVYFISIRNQFVHYYSVRLRLRVIEKAFSNSLTLYISVHV